MPEASDSGGFGQIDCRDTTYFSQQKYGVQNAYEDSTGPGSDLVAVDTQFNSRFRSGGTQTSQA